MAAAKPENQRGQAAPPDDSAAYSAETHYFRGNRFYELKAWDKAVSERRKAFQIWHGPAAAARRIGRRFLHLRAALAVTKIARPASEALSSASKARIRRQFAVTLRAKSFSQSSVG